MTCLLWANWYRMWMMMNRSRAQCWLLLLHAAHSLGSMLCTLWRCLCWCFIIRSIAVFSSWKRRRPLRCYSAFWTLTTFISYSHHHHHHHHHHHTTWHLTHAQLRTTLSSSMTSTCHVRPCSRTVTIWAWNELMKEGGNKLRNEFTNEGMTSRMSEWMSEWILTSDIAIATLYVMFTDSFCLQCWLDVCKNWVLIYLTLS